MSMLLPPDFVMHTSTVWMKSFFVFEAVLVLTMIPSLNLSFPDSAALRGPEHGRRIKGFARFPQVQVYPFLPDCSEIFPVSMSDLRFSQQVWADHWLNRSDDSWYDVMIIKSALSGIFRGNNSGYFIKEIISWFHINIKIWLSQLMSYKFIWGMNFWEGIFRHILVLSNRLINFTVMIWDKKSFHT